MLVVDVPERPLLQDPLHVGKLEEHVDVAPVADRLAHQPDEIEDRRDVLQRVATAHVIGVQMRILRPVEVADEADAIRGAAAGPFRPIAWIDARCHRSRCARRAPTRYSPLPHPISSAAIPGPSSKRRDLIIPDLVEKPQKPRRVSLRLLVGRRVSLQRRIEPDVADEAAAAAKRRARCHLAETPGPLACDENIRQLCAGTSLTR